MANEIRPPTGTRDFSGDELRRRDAALASIKRTFGVCGFEPLETPAFERIEVLTGKYGEDERLIFRIAKRGVDRDTGEPDLALRYDHTVPLARFVASQRSATDRVLRSYQIGPVWRADRPARGRFREFVQCDVDIVGSTSWLADADVLLTVNQALRDLGLTDFAIHLNSRKALMGLMLAYCIPTDLGALFVSTIDKLQRMGPDRVAATMRASGIPGSSVDQFEADQQSGDPAAAVGERLTASDIGRTGLSEVRGLEDLASPSLQAGTMCFDPYLARGLDYYTGPIFEVFARHGEEGPLSIASGGRYDDLIGSLSGRPTPACGASLGFERLMPLIKDPSTPQERTTQVLVTVWDEELIPDALSTALELRAAGIATETSLEPARIATQLRYASRKGIPLCVLQGPEERAAGQVTLKNLHLGRQATCARKRLVSAVKGLW